MLTLHTNFGDIEMELDFEHTPVTAKNFLDYARSGFFDNTIFHRVIDNFMIQGGGFDINMDQKSTNAPIKNEANNSTLNKRGSVAMARTNDPHSATAQFFINIVDNNFLNFSAETQQGWGYCVFGQVTKGLDVIDEIRKVATHSSDGHQDVPVEPVLIERVTVKETAEA